MQKIVIDDQSKITLPQDIVSQLHLSSGDEFQVEISGDSIILKPDAEGFDTPEILESIDRGLKDVEEGKTNGPFSNANELLKSLNA